MKQVSTLGIVVLCSLVIGCKDPEPKDATDGKTADSTLPTKPVYDTPLRRDTGTIRANTENFPKVVRKEYSYLATNVPKSVVDSLMKLRDPDAIQRGMNAYLKYQESLAKSTLCSKYRISPDSLEKIIKDTPPDP